MKSVALALCAAFSIAMPLYCKAAEPHSRDALAAMFVARESEWAEQICTHKIVEPELLWDDFVGTDTKGGRYSKQQSIAESKSHMPVARDCRLLETQVHFFSEQVAVVVGSETAVEIDSAGRQERKCLFWTDTWIQRQGEWKIAAAQDARLPCPKGVETANGAVGEKDSPRQK